MKLKVKRKVPFIEQLLTTECGLCCAAMIMRYYGSYETLFSLRESTDIGRDGLSISQLQNLLEVKGLETQIYRGNIEGLETFEGPVIIYWSNNHFVVLEEFSSKKIIICDPSLGRRRISKKELEKNFCEYILVATPNENFKRIPKSKSVWKDSLSNIFENKALFLKLIVLSIITYMATLSIPIGVQYIIDSISKSNDEIMKNAPYIVGIFLVAYMLLMYLRGRKLIDLQVVIDKAITKKTFRHLLSVPYKFFDVRAKGELLFRLNSLQVIRDLLSEQITQGIIDLGAFAFILTYMMYKSIYLTIIALAIFGINVFYIIFTRTSIRTSNTLEITENGKLQSFQVETIYAILGIKTSGIENEIYNSWENRYQSFLERFIARSRLINNYVVLVNSVQKIGPIVLLFFGLRQFAIGRITIGEVFAFYTLAGTFYSLAVSLSNGWNNFLLATSYMERLRDITQTELERLPEKPESRKVTGDIRIENVSFSYAKHSKNVLNNINMSIRPGEKVAIVGSSGSGKTTLSKLLLGLYGAEEGKIYYDGIDFENYDKKELRRQIGIVPQDMYLFNKSILDNIRMNNENISLERVKEAARIAQISEEIEQMPMNYYTPISEMGMNISGGQRQRIALARAIVNDPRIIILDEATSYLDSINEKKVSDYFRKKNCTLIVIAHRLSTIIDSDKIFVMDNGRIVDEGTHEELMRRKGIYYDLYKTHKNPENEILEIAL